MEEEFKENVWLPPLNCTITIRLEPLSAVVTGIITDPFVSPELNELYIYKYTYKITDSVLYSVKVV